jgi:simple sugar transport system ATP-binding protein
VARNASAAQLDKVVGRSGLISRSREARLGSEVIERMGVNNRDTATIIENLSGGNQQKVVIGRGVVSGPSVSILDSPTVGVDIGAKSEIYAQIHRMADEGMGVIIISDEPEEIVANCNRVLVMHTGRIVASFDSDDVARADFKERLAALIANPDAVPAGAGAEDGR